MQTKVPRLDILIYAHDGRGLGHVSRSAAIGMALRRLFPELKVLLVTGSSMAQELIGEHPLDWLKLPAYATEVVAGVSRGIAGPSGFEDSELGKLRATQLQQIVALYKPRVVLADHTPQGKHRELLPALRYSSAKIGGHSRWILGVRGVVGGVSQAGSEMARTAFHDYYQDLFWYGDSTVLGMEHLQLLENFYKVASHECGYVARLKELMAEPMAQDGSPLPAVTVSLPWLGENSVRFISQLAKAIRTLGPDHGRWNIFCEQGGNSYFEGIPHCRLFPFSGIGYAESLAASRAAVIFGGYNSIVDVLSLSIPTLVVMREMADKEQQIHLQLLHDNAGGSLYGLEESKVTTALLLDNFERILQLSKKGGGSFLRAANGGGRTSRGAINFAGAENAAMRLNQIVQEQSDA